MIESNFNRLYPVIISIPHSGSKYSKDFIESTQLDKKELKFSEDSYVDDLLIRVLQKKINFIKANFPRSYVDVNRHPFEIDPLMISSRIPNFKNSNSIKVKSGIGVIPRVSVYGNEIYNYSLTRKEIVRRLLLYYFPYHKKLKFMINYLKKEYNNILVLDFHSMPSYSLVKNKDIILGNNHNLSCNKGINALVKYYFQSYKYSVDENIPYAGGYITKSLGKPDKGINVIQIEINRFLYMNEKSLLKKKNNINLLAIDLSRIIEKITISINNFN